MRRRTFLGAAAMALSAPHLGRASPTSVLRFIPVSDLAVLDPVWTGARVTRNHGYLVFDTLYGLDERLVVQFQMVERQQIGVDGRRWSLTLRPGLRFHDGEPVRASDAVASIRRFCARDSYGQSLMAATDELSAADDRTIVFRLKRPSPHLPHVLAGSTANMPCIMPERLARTDPFKPVTEMIGSGPYRFVADEHIAGSRTVYERFEAYQPRSDGKANFLAGAKIVHFDRVEWITIPDQSTAAAALHTGEVDWWELPSPDLLPSVAADRNLQLATSPMQTAIGIMRFNHLYPPFNNPEVRRALLGIVDQAACMQAVAGADRELWRDGIGLFGPGSPLSTKAGTEVLSDARNPGRVRKALAEAGYRGETVVALDTADIPVIHTLTAVGMDELRQAGMVLDVQTVDFGTATRRRNSNQPPDQGGWNVFCTFIDGTYNFTPGGNSWLRGNGEWIGWPRSARLEELCQAWLDAPDLASEQRICRELQLQFFRDVPYIPMGEYDQPTCFRRTLTDVPKGFPLFYGVRRA